MFFIFTKIQQFLTGPNSPSNQGIFCYNEEVAEERPCTESVATLVDQIVQLLEEQQIYKFPGLDLNALSERLKAPAYMVTRAINEGLGVNFYDLINRYRVEEVKSLLKNSNCKKFTLLAVAFDAGFSSKTTFNTVFKKMTGLTPSSYRDQHCFEAEIARMDQSSVIKRMRAIKVGHLAN